MDKVIKRETIWARIWEFCCENAMWAMGGFALELASDGTTAAVGGAAMAAGLSGSRRLYALGGALFGAVLHGFPTALSRLAGLGIVLAAQLIPDLKNVIGSAIIRFFSAALAVFFSRIADTAEPSELLMTLIAALTGGAFAACLHILVDTVKMRGFDISEMRDCTVAAAISALSFMTLAALDYPVFNLGRLTAGLLVLTVSARRGLAAAAVIGIPALYGLSCSADTAGCSAAVILAALLSICLSKYGKLTRAVGYVFFGCVGILISSAADSAWSLFAEMIISAALFALLPVENIGMGESDFSDKTVAMMLRERLCFAADAISGVSSGLNAAAETLERRYSATLQQVGEDAADKACKNCPNNMMCWGQKYELFHAEFNRLVKLQRCGAELTEQSLSPLVAQECIRRTEVLKAIKAAYDRYLSAASDERRVRELRRIYTEQLASVHDILEDMGYSAGKGGGKNRSAEKRAEKALSDCGLKDTAAFISQDRKGRLLLEAYGSGELRTEKEYLGELLINALGRELELPEVSASGGRVRVTTTERTQFSAEIGSFQLCKGKNRVCGDCFDSFTDPSGLLYIILSDGMGSGSRARIDSALACSMTSKLLKSGLSLGAALETVNTSLMVKSADESFATLDICRIDLNTGECAVFKAGAATTYIKCADKLVRASLSSPPAGTGGRLTVPAQRFTVGSGDVIIMTTDGAAIDEEWLSHELSAKVDPKELSEKIARTARSAENGREDDISVITVAVGR
ncbi:MAG: SpoIIE family protein phosphatase [Oscillospiraceae bacterium]|nr:SpoIIE family protein phosphatase [Oscillospiraceae bacterium]